MTDIILEFQAESLELVQQMQQILEKCEEAGLSPNEVQKVAQYADRILGASRQITTPGRPETKVLELIGQLTQLCKILGYKASQLKMADELYPTAVGILLDASSELEHLLNQVVHAQPKETGVSTHLVERLSWLNQQFAQNIDGMAPMSQVEDLIAAVKSTDSSDQSSKD